MKTTKEKANDWNCKVSDVRDYCKIIPDAIKSDKFPFCWLIPDVAKPPMKFKEAVNFLKKILLIKEGAEINFLAIGYETSKVNDIYTYLANNGYITSLNSETDLNKKLKSASLTSLGKKLMKSAEKKKVNRTTKKSAYIGLNAGLIQANANVETTEEEEMSACS